MSADYSCPDCGGRLEGEDGVFECVDCSMSVVEQERIVETAEKVRREGFNDLANRLEAASEAARDAENEV